MKIVAIVQARFSSTRLPGKVLLPLGNSTVLAQVVSRARLATRLYAVWVATSTHPTDDAVAAEAARIGAPCFRGNLEDVLARYHSAALAAEADVIVRITSDCPLFDGVLLNQMLADYIAETQAGRAIDYLSNFLQRTFPRGLDAEVFTLAALERARTEAKDPYDREHVTPYIYKHPELFKLRSFTSTENLSVHRWTLDTPDDWRLIQGIYKAFPDPSRNFSTREVLTLLVRCPELRMVNAHIVQKTDPSTTPTLT